MFKKNQNKISVNFQTYTLEKRVSGKRFPECIHKKINFIEYLYKFIDQNSLSDILNDKKLF